MDGFVAQYNADRPHQALDPDQPVTPADRFTPIPQQSRDLLPVWLPPTLATAPTVPAGAGTSADEETARLDDRLPAGSPWAGGPVEFDKVVPPSGNMQLAGKQVWLGPVRSGQMVRFWADVNLIHLLIGGTRVKTVRSHLTVTDLA